MKKYIWILIIIIIFLLSCSLFKPSNSIFCYNLSSVNINIYLGMGGDSLDIPQRDSGTVFIRYGYDFSPIYITDLSNGKLYEYINGWAGQRIRIREKNGELDIDWGR